MAFSLLVSSEIRGYQDIDDFKEGEEKGGRVLGRRSDEIGPMIDKQRKTRHATVWFARVNVLACLSPSSSSRRQNAAHPLRYWFPPFHSCS